MIITRHPSGRNWYTVTTIAQGAVTLLAIHRLIDLSPWQQIELFSVLAGLILLTVGHLGWFKEQDQQSDLVSTSLLLVHFGQCASGHCDVDRSMARRLLPVE
ncbi:MAG: hypothetical protein U0936_17235 [Planctomycetaceae bacterium]